MFYHNINPVIAKIGPLEIRWYGFMYVISFIIAYFMILYLVKKKKIKLKREDVENFIAYSIIGLVVGARIFYVLFYNLKFYLENPIEIFMIWHGGLSFHGGLIGLIVVGYLFCKKHKISFYEFADVVSIPAYIGSMLGRIGNFINGELYGRITDVPWAFKFKDVDGFRHPSQLYEAFYNLIIFSVLWKLKDRKFPKGFIFWSGITMYGLFRFITEFFREPDPQLGFIFLNLTMGQLLAIPMFLIGSVMLMYLLKKERFNKEEK